MVRLLRRQAGRLNVNYRTGSESSLKLPFSKSSASESVVGVLEVGIEMSRREAQARESHQQAAVAPLNRRSRAEFDI